MTVLTPPWWIETHVGGTVLNNLMCVVEVPTHPSSTFVTLTVCQTTHSARMHNDLGEGLVTIPIRPTNNQGTTPSLGNNTSSIRRTTSQSKLHTFTIDN